MYFSKHVCWSKSRQFTQNHPCLVDLGFEERGLIETENFPETPPPDPRVLRQVSPTFDLILFKLVCFFTVKDILLDRAMLIRIKVLLDHFEIIYKFFIEYRHYITHMGKSNEQFCFYITIIPYGSPSTSTSQKSLPKAEKTYFH